MAATAGRPAGVAIERASTPRSATSRRSARGTCARKIDSHPRSSVRTPASSRPERSPEHARHDPDPERTLVSLALREEVERRGHEKRGADCLDAAGADQDVEGRREAADQRRSAEHESPRGVGLARTPTRDVRGRNGDHREHEMNDVNTHETDVIATSNRPRISGSASVTIDESASASPTPTASNARRMARV